jgi:hypothetical protein
MADTLTSTTAPKKTEDQKLGLAIEQPQVQGATQGYLGQSFAYTGQPNKPTGTGITQRTAGAGQYLSANAGSANQLAQQATRGINAGPNYTFGKSMLDAGILGQARNFTPVAQAPALSSHQTLLNVENQARNSLIEDANAPRYEGDQGLGDTTHFSGLVDYLNNNSNNYLNTALSNSDDIAQALAAEDMLSRQGETQAAIGSGDFGALQELLTRGISEGDYRSMARATANAETRNAGQRGLDAARAEVTGLRDKSVHADELQNRINLLLGELAREPEKTNKQAIGSEITNLEQELLNLGLGRQPNSMVSDNPTYQKITRATDLLSKVRRVRSGENNYGHGFIAEVARDLKKLGLKVPDSFDDVGGMNNGSTKDAMGTKAYDRALDAIAYLESQLGVLQRGLQKG